MILVLRTVLRIRELRAANTVDTDSLARRYTPHVVRECHSKILSGDEESISQALEISLGAVEAELLLRCMKEAKAPTALVGGWLRDLILNKASGDVDLISGDPDLLASKLREYGTAKAVLLDAGRRTWRVVFSNGSYIDISAPRGKGPDLLSGDLELRDLRVNAMAWSPSLGFVDPLGGLDDLRDGVLRATSITALTDDPLRALRCWRLAIQLDMSLSCELRDDLRGLSLDEIAGERTASELQQILLHPGAPVAIEGLAEAGILQQLLPGAKRLALFRRCMQRSYESPALQRCLAAVYNEGDSWIVGLRLGWLLQAPRLKKELLTRRWSRRSARLASIGSLQVERVPNDNPYTEQIDSELRRWKDASSVAILCRVAQLGNEEAEVLAGRYLEVLGDRAMGGALTDSRARE